MSNARPSMNYYEILEVAHDAPQNEIHRAYQKAKQTYSQDNPALYSMFSKEEARELVRMIEEAYQVLGNQASRRAYDDSLGAGGASFEAASNGSAGEGDASNGASPRSAAAPESEAAQRLQHASLPDFPVKDASGAASDLGEFVVRTRPSAKPPLPAGHGRTALSTYAIDEAVEAEIASREEWDGTAIQKVRAYKNVSLDKLSDATRVSRAYLAAVEANDYSNLPAHVFVRGFVAQTARILGLDEAKVAGSYVKLLKAATSGKNR